MTVAIILAEQPTDQDRTAILQPLLAYNDEKVGPSGFEPIALLLKDEQTSETLGGLWAQIAYDWLFVDLLFVPEHLRGRHLGSTLLAKAEAIGRERHCVGVWLDTHGFQAPAFYIKNGYEAFATLDDHPRGSSRVFFRKSFA